MKKFAAIAAACLLAAGVCAAFAGCGGTGEQDVTLDKNTLALLSGEEERLTATSASGKAIAWSSDKPEVAAVDGGLVRDVSAGEATITASAGEAAVSCAVTVYPDEAYQTFLREDFVSEQVTDGQWEQACAAENFTEYQLMCRNVERITDPSDEAFELVSEPWQWEAARSADALRFLYYQSDGSPTEDYIKITEDYITFAGEDSLHYYTENGQWHAEEISEKSANDAALLLSPNILAEKPHTYSEKDKGYLVQLTGYGLPALVKIKGGRVVYWERFQEEGGEATFLTKKNTETYVFYRHESVSVPQEVINGAQP